MLGDETDVPDTRFVFDCEWVGDMCRPHTAHITEVAVYSLRTRNSYQASCTALASTLTMRTAYARMGTAPTVTTTGTCSDVLAGLIAFIEAETRECTTAPVLIGHNAIRYDAPVLIHNMQRCNLSIPNHWLVMDSLHHARFLTRHRGGFCSFGLHELCIKCNIAVDSTQLHNAMYDTMLLHNLLQTMSDQWQVPYISGCAQRMAVLSPMLIHGVGPSVALVLGTDSLYMLCLSIVDAYGSLSSDSCEKYLAAIAVQTALPKADTTLIAQNIQPTAERYLHYLS